MEDTLKIQLNQTEDLPFSEQEIFQTIADNLEQIDTASDEACLLVNERMAIVLFWEDDKIVVEQVVRAEALKRE